VLGTHRNYQLFRRQGQPFYRLQKPLADWDYQRISSGASGDYLRLLCHLTEQYMKNLCGKNGMAAKLHQQQEYPCCQ
jgi:hypothetical protein